MIIYVGTDSELLVELVKKMASVCYVVSIVH